MTIHNRSLGYRNKSVAYVPIGPFLEGILSSIEQIADGRNQKKKNPRGFMIFRMSDVPGHSPIV